MMNEQLRELVEEAAEKGAEKACTKTREDLEQVVREIALSVAEKHGRRMLERMNIDPDHLLEMQRDVIFLRSLRTTTEVASRRGFLAAVVLFTTAAGTLIVMGLKTWFKQH